MVAVFFILLFILFIVLILVFIHWSLKVLPIKKWRKEFPIVYEEYLKKHPENNGVDGLKCFNCGSRYLHNTAVVNVNNRQVSCNHCSEKLYRNEKS